METEKTSNETEKSRILAKISATQQTDLLTKHQNGDQSPEVPANLQGIFDQSMFGMNGQMKHALNEQALLDFHQTKTLVNGNENPRIWDKNEAGMENRLEVFPKHKAGDFEITHGKINCNFSNGDLFSLSRNKQVQMPNGATTSPPSVKGTTGDLLEKTLSQYYPEHVSIAPQTNSSQVDQVTSNLPDQATSSPSFTSGFPISPRISASETLAKAPSEVQNSNGYNPELAVNGYSSSAAEQKKPAYSLADLPELSHEDSESNVPSQTVVNGSSQIQEDREGLPNGSECLNLFSKSNQNFSHESCILPPATAGSPSQTSQTGQHNPQIKVAQKKTNDENLHGIRDFSLLQQQTHEPQAVESKLIPQACSSPSQNHSKDQDNKPKSGLEKTLSKSTDPSSQMEWIDLNSTSTPTPSTDHSQMWDLFLPQTHMQQHTVSQSQSQCINSMPPNNFQSHNFSNSSFPSHELEAQENKTLLPPTQFPHRATPESQQRNSGMHNHINRHFNNPQHMSQQLCKDDQDQILSPSFLSQLPTAEPHQQATSTFCNQLPQDRQNMQASPLSRDVSRTLR